MDIDYPAAHSMDTQWYAVDRDGHVASFGSGEAGAVPLEAQLENAAGPHQEMAAILPHCEIAYDLQGHLTPGEGDKGTHEGLTADGRNNFLVFLTSLTSLRPEIAEGRAVQVPAQGAIAVILRRATADLMERLHRNGDCLSCFWHFEDDDEWIEPARLGLFSYSHLCENWISGPYGRKRVPLQPVHIDQLPPAVRQLVTQMRFPHLCFGEVPHIQPVEHDICVSWESAFLSSDGTTIRRIPANMMVVGDDAYREFIEELQEFIRERGYRVELPPEKKAP
jgi:hypothetical protein